jgi:DNA polymerase-1
MTPEALIRLLHENDVCLDISAEGNLALDGDPEVISRYIAVIKQNKTAVLELLKARSSIHIIKDGSGFFEFVTAVYKNQVRHVIIDTETSGLDPFTCELVLIQVHAAGKTYIIDHCAIPKQQQQLFYRGVKRILEDDGIIKIFHNALFDLKFIRRHLFPEGIKVKNIFDTMLAEQLLTAGIAQRGDHSLKAVTKKYLNIELDKTEQTSFKPGQHFTDSQLRYAASDVRHLEAICKLQAAELAKENLTDVAMLEFSIIEEIARMELAGIHFNAAGLETMKSHLLDEETRLEKELDAIVKAAAPAETGINYKSPVQVKKVFSILGIKADGTGSGH